MPTCTTKANRQILGLNARRTYFRLAEGQYGIVHLPIGGKLAEAQIILANLVLAMDPLFSPERQGTAGWNCSEIRKSLDLEDGATKGHQLCQIGAAGTNRFE